MAKNLSRLFVPTSKILTAPTVIVSTKKKTTETIKEKGVSLYRRLAALGNPNSDLKQILNEHVDSGKKLNKREIIGIVHEFRKYKRYSQALQILEWMEKRDCTKLAPSDHAIRLDLLYKMEGIECVEKYFVSFPGSAKNKPIYGALLHCYCKENMTEKAAALVGKMKELDIVDTSLVYNNLMSLHMRIGEPEKVSLLLQEMKEKNISPDFHTYIFLMNSYATLNEMEGVEKVLEEMKADGVHCDWMTYTNLACIYIKAGLLDKANSTLEKVENMDNLRERKAYNMLIGLYAQTSNKEGVKRVWQSLRSTFPDTTNTSYFAMLQALVKWDDLEELKMWYEEWNSQKVTYDIRIANVLVGAYLRCDMFWEANRILHEATYCTGVKQNLRTFELFMKYHLEKNEMDLALKNFEGACFKAKENKWQPSQENVSMFLDHFIEEKNVDGAERCYKSLKNVNCLNSEVYQSLLQTYWAAGLTEPHIRQRMEEVGIEISAEIEKLLNKVCPE